MASRARPSDLAQVAAATGTGDGTVADYRVAHTSALLPALDELVTSAPRSPLVPGARMPVGNVAMFAAAGLGVSVCAWPGTTSGDRAVALPAGTAEGRFRAGTTVLNPGFLPDALDRVEALLTLGRPPWAPSLRDARMLTRVLADLVALVAESGSLLFLTSPVAPVVDPSKSVRGDGSGERTRDPQGPCIRFAVGLDGRGRSRLGLERALAELAVDNGLGLKLADRRVDRVRGEWFTIRRFDRQRYAAVRDAAYGGLAGGSLRRAVAVTVVGPARAGTTRALLAALDHRSVGVLAISTTELQGIGVDSVVLPVVQPDPDGSGRPRARASWSSGLDAVAALCGTGPPLDDRPDARLPDGYALLVGEVLPCRFPSVSRQTGAANSRKTPYPLWATWDSPAYDADTPAVLRALADALAARTVRHELLYATSRLVGQDRVRGRAKFAVVLSSGRGDLPPEPPPVQDELHALATTVEEEVLRALPLRLSVSAEERWLPTTGTAV